MPSSKSKKQQSRTATRLLNSDQNFSSPSTQDPCSSEEEHQQHVQLLDQASQKYPHLISQDALVCCVSTIPASADDKCSKGSCKIWLSESCMVSSSIAPGSIVSVSIPLLRMKGLGSEFALSSLQDESARHFGFCFAENLEANELAGNYFVLATVFPSSKLLKNGVRLSPNLSSMLGYPALGTILYIYPIHYQSLTCGANGNDTRHETSARCISLYNCKELYLSLVLSKENFSMSSTGSSYIDSPLKAANGWVEDMSMSSPRTPSSLSKPSSTCPSRLNTPNSKGVVSDKPDKEGLSEDLLDMAEVLEDNTAKKLLQMCTYSWLTSHILLPGNLVMVPVLSRLCIFQVTGASKSFATDNEDRDDESSEALTSMDHMRYAFSVDHGTKINLTVQQNSLPDTAGERTLPNGNVRPNVGFQLPKLGGLSKEFAILKEIISSSMMGTLASMGVRPTKGVLLHGPPGTGKTSLAQFCAHDAGVNLFSVNGPEIVSQYYGESEQALSEAFGSASEATPAVVFIDELDAIAPARKEGSDELSQRMVATLLSLMDGITRTDGLLVIASTNRPDSVEPALRRPGRFDREIEIGVPSPKQRYEIMLALLSEMEHSLSDSDVQHLSMATHGFVGADLAALCNEAALVCLRRYADFKNSCSGSNNGSSCPENGDSFITVTGVSHLAEDGNDNHLNNHNHLEVTSSSSEAYSSSENQDTVILDGTCTTRKCILTVTLEDFEEARLRVRPSAMREVILEIPKVSWDDVGGQNEVKLQLMEAVEWPQIHQDAFRRIGTRPPAGVLMFGPPGCSKTLLARAVASEARLNFLSVKGPELFSKWVGESEKAVKSLFAKARANAPSIIFFDEIDGLATIRGKESDGVSVADRVMSQLLIELDGLQQRVNVTVIAATNRPDKIDPALLRPGRFDRLLYVGPPNEKDREDIFNVHLRKMPCNSSVCIKELARLTKGCTGADISLICREAAVAAIEDNLDATEITMEHLKAGIRQVQPSEVQPYEELSSKFERVVCSTAEFDDPANQLLARRSNLISFWSLGRFIGKFFHWFPASLWLSKSCPD